MFVKVQFLAAHNVPRSDRYLVLFVQMEDVHQGGDGWPAVGALEGELAAGQRRHQAEAFVSAKGVVEFNSACWRVSAQSYDAFTGF